ncbi:MAG: nucleoside recognition domain-containing protein [Verrucomicrobiota bacterium]
MISASPHCNEAATPARGAEPKISLTALAIGMEGVGKSQLLSRLSGSDASGESCPEPSASMSSCGHGVLWKDSPGFRGESENETALLQLNELNESDRVVLVARADQAREQLASILPLVDGRKGLVVLTFADRLPEKTDRTEMEQDFRDALGVPVFVVDARRFDPSTRNAMVEVITGHQSDRFQHRNRPHRLAPDPNDSPPLSLLDQLIGNPLIAALLLLLPSVIAVNQANRFADWVNDPLTRILKPLQDWLEQAPPFLGALLVGDYGVVSMFPFLLLYALPTILVFSAILTVYKSSGLIDRLSRALHPWLRPFGIGGHDLVRVVMGFGCNVPAVVASRSCASCTRGTCISAISFGSACSYQLPATLAVFAAANMNGLGIVYVGLLAVTTLIYLYFTTPACRRQAGQQLLQPEFNPLKAPSLGGIGREVVGDLRQFVIMAVPVFVVICFAAASLAFLGVLDAFARCLAPLMALFNLPGGAATAIALGSIRKDGIAIGLLDDDWGALKVGFESPAQVLAAVYLAGVILPCLVTLFTIGREMGWKFAARLTLRQIAWASAFGLTIAWIGELII